MELKETRIFSTYVLSLYSLLRQKTIELKTKGVTEEIGTKYQLAATKVFSFYQNIISDRNYFGKFFREITDEDKKTYKCHLDNDNNTFELVRVLDYRGMEIPEYLDDYGMDTFIEVLNPNTNTYTTISSMHDWNYALDEMFDVDWLFNPKDDYASRESKLNFMNENLFYTQLQ